jgi:hypothetical protein
MIRMERLTAAKQRSGVKARAAFAALSANVGAHQALAAVNAHRLSYSPEEAFAALD